MEQLELIAKVKAAINDVFDAHHIYHRKIDMYSSLNDHWERDGDLIYIHGIVGSANYHGQLYLPPNKPNELIENEIEILRRQFKNSIVFSEKPN